MNAFLSGNTGTNGQLFLLRHLKERVIHPCPRLQAWGLSLSAGRALDCRLRGSSWSLASERPHNCLASVTIPITQDTMKPEVCLFYLTQEGLLAFYPAICTGYWEDGRRGCRLSSYLKTCKEIRAFVEMPLFGSCPCFKGVCGKPLTGKATTTAAQNTARRLCDQTGQCQYHSLSGNRATARSW